jgi:hypothetical protein
VVTRKAQGFTMIEAAAALLLLSAIATSIAILSSSHLRWLGRSHEETAAWRRAAAELEDTLGAADAPSEGVSSFDVEGVALGGGKAAGTRRVSRVATGLFRVEAEVSWHAADGGTGTAHLATLVARKEPR